MANKHVSIWLFMCFLGTSCAAILMPQASLYSPLILSVFSVGFYGPLFYFLGKKKVSASFFLKINFLPFLFLIAFLKIGVAYFRWQNFDLSGCVYMLLYLMIALSFLWVGIYQSRPKRSFRKEKSILFYLTLLVGLLVVEQVLYTAFIAYNPLVLSTESFQSYFFSSANFSFLIFIFWFYKTKLVSSENELLGKLRRGILLLAIIQCFLMNALLLSVFKDIQAYQAIAITLLSYLFSFSLELQAKRVYVAGRGGDNGEKKKKYIPHEPFSEISEQIPDDKWHIV
ncbi:MAG: hypothetical protein ACTSXQ_01440 [Alphaproteobacteria bacterium]